MLTTGNFDAQCYTPAEYWLYPLSVSSNKTDTADRVQREGAMDETTLTGPLLYLLIAWGIATAVFLALILWRSILTTHEDDQLCIDAAGEHMAQEQRELIAKITKLSRPIATSGIAAGALLLLIAGMWLYQGLKSF
jgi:hypothetical protein